MKMHQEEIYYTCATTKSNEDLVRAQLLKKGTQCVQYSSHCEGTIAVEEVGRETSIQKE